MVSKAWTLSAQEALAYFGVTAEFGLSEIQYKANREAYGQNGKF
jgi:hypothetical protein